MTRAQTESLVVRNGGTPKKSITTSLNYLVTNSTKYTAKFIQAKDKGIEIITEKQFFDML